ncbi:outer membrane protein OmpK [Shewanella sp.]|uniref:outer membrane protein OmpK n=1 Tax=Shewanella sp. TaxID=50422 RepID=UPI0025885CC3|nr:outer membrane protein OmpK [Shewanella sp.]MCJ8304890.1 ion channel protein Tsx [Shewanella sp.]
MNNKWILVALLASPTAFAESLIHWSDFSVTALYGDSFEVDPAEQTTITLETAGGWKYGDWFAFQDFVYFNDAPSDSNHANYGEYGTRFSASKIFDSKVGFGPLTDLSLALQYEQGNAAASTILYGIGSDWAVPGFSYLNVNVYYRSELSNPSSFDKRGHSDGWQLAPSWRIDFGDTGIVFDGYIDWVFSPSEDAYEPMLHINPQLKYDLGAVINGKSGKFYVGVEYDYWKNKYGIPNGIPGLEVDQSVFSLLIKYHL